MRLIGVVFFQCQKFIGDNFLDFSLIEIRESLLVRSHSSKSDLLMLLHRFFLRALGFTFHLIGLVHQLLLFQFSLLSHLKPVEDPFICDEPVLAVIHD